MLDLFIKGGPVMYPILFCSIISLGIVLERVYYLNIVENKGIEKLKKEIMKLVRVGDIKSAKDLCIQNNHSIGKVLYTIIDNMDDDRELLEERIREVMLDRILYIKRYMWLLNLGVQIAPVLGLLGTITGMIRAFAAISLEGASRGVVASGISEALITTAAGLIVAVPAMILYGYLNSKIEMVVIRIEKTSVELLNYIKGDLK